MSYTKIPLTVAGDFPVTVFCKKDEKKYNLYFELKRAYSLYLENIFVEYEIGGKKFHKSFVNTRLIQPVSLRCKYTIAVSYRGRKMYFSFYLGLLPVTNLNYEILR